MVRENKSSFFSVTLPVQSFDYNDNYLDNLDDQMDLILSGIGVNDRQYKFANKNSQEIVYLFKTEAPSRKRKGQLTKLCNRHLNQKQGYIANALTVDTFQDCVNRYKLNKNFILLKEPNSYIDYKGEDIQILNDPEKWYDWQKDLFHKLFEIKKDQPISSNIKQYKIRKPDPRKIISIIDPSGCSGKSIFFKFLYVNFPTKMLQLNYGSSQQLRSAIVRNGKKEIYTVDLSRAKGKDDREEDLLNSIESCKSGTIQSNLFGTGSILIQEPPHIIITSNYVLSYDLLSEDRWEIFKIDKKTYKLIEISTDRQIEDLMIECEKINVKTEIRKEKVRSERKKLKKELLSKTIKK